MTVAYLPQLAECCSSTATMPAPFDIYAMVESFGAAADGITDDTDAFVRALADGRPIGLAANRSYAISGVIIDAATTCPGIFSLGGQARIVPVATNPAGACFTIRKPADFCFDGLFFDLPISTDPLVAPGWDRALGFSPDASPAVGRRYRVERCRFSGGNYGVTMIGAFDNCRVVDSYFTATWREAILAQALHNCDITGNTIEDGGHATGGPQPAGAIRTGYSAQIEASLNVRIAGNTIARYCQESGQSAIDCFAGAARNLQITANTIEVCGSGIELKTQPWALESPDVYNTNLVADNVVRLRSDVASTTGVSLFYTGGTSPAGKGSRMLVSGNLIAGVNVPASGSAIYGIVSNGFDDITLSGNQILNVGHAIAVSGFGDSDATAHDVVISGNTLESVDSAIVHALTANTIDGLHITNNPLIRTTAAGWPAISLGNHLINAEITGNLIESLGGPAIDVRDVHDTNISDNALKGGAEAIVVQGAPAASGLTIRDNDLIAAVGPACQIGVGTDIAVQGNNIDIPIGARTVSGVGGWQAANNNRGMAAANPSGTAARTQGDTFSDSTAATAGWRCTTAGNAGVAVYTVI